MQMIRTLSLGAATLVFSVAAFAQFDGPAPLAWRWMQNASVSSGMPAVDGDTVYVAAGQRIYALDKDSGNQRWKFPNVDPIPGTFKGRPIVTGGMVIAAADNKTIYAVNTATHDVKWTYLAPVPILGEPVLADKYIVVKLNDNSLMAVDVATGQPAWKDPLKFLTGLTGQIASYQSNVLVLTDDNQILSYSVVNPSKPVWHKSFSSLATDAAPYVSGESVYVASGPFLNSLNAASGSVRWSTNVGEDIAYAPAITPTGSIVVTRDRHLYALDANGRRNPKIQVDLGSDPQTRPTVVGDLVVVPTSNGAINLINPKTGDILWSYVVRPVGEVFIQPAGRTGSGGTGGGGGTQNPIRILTIPAAGPAVVDGSTLFMLASDGSLLAFDKNLGVDLTPPSVKQTWPTPGEVVSGQPPLMLVFKIEDEASGINEKTLKIDIDGTPLDYTFGRDGLASISISQFGKNKPLQDGRRNVHVTVADWMGNVTDANFALTIDNTLAPLRPPSIDNKGGGPGGGAGGRGGGLNGGGGIGGR